MKTLEELRKAVQAQANFEGNWIKEPTPVNIVGTTFGNEIQTKILTSMMVSNFFLFYLCTIQTLGHLGWFK